MKKIVLFLLLLIEINVQAQDPVSSQSYFNQLIVNPAFAGIKKNARVGLDSRLQWTGIPGQFNTYNFWGDIYIPTLKPNFFPLSIGVVALEDVEGEGLLKTSSFGVVQSFDYCIIKKILKLTFGSNIMFTNKRIDWNKLVFSDQLDGTAGQIYPSAVVPGVSAGKTFFDPSAGVIITWNKSINKTDISTILGYAVNHLTTPNEGLSGLEDRYLPRTNTIHCTIDFAIKDKRGGNAPSFSISPNFIYEKQANFTTTNVGIYMGRKQLIVGLFFRDRKVIDFKDVDSGIIFLGTNQKINKTNVLKFGLSYDITVNNLGTNTMGTYEISISWEFNKKERTPVDCAHENIDHCQCPSPFFY